LSKGHYSLRNGGTSVCYHGSAVPLLPRQHQLPSTEARSESGTTVNGAMSQLGRRSGVYAQLIGGRKDRS
jgi:hypothetical protein